jgi:hypothetical protein
MNGEKFLSDHELEHLLIEADVTETDIMQYADGVLEPPRRPAIRRALAQYPGLMQLLESFLFTRGPMAEAFDEVFLQAPPRQLLDRLENAEQPPAKPRRKLFGFSPASRRPFKFKLRAPVVAVTALAALVLTAGVTRYLTRYDFIPPDRQGAPVPQLLQQALEGTPTGETARLNERLSVQVQLTFFSRLQTWCREYGLIYGNRAYWVGQIACRGKDDFWRVHAFTNPLLLRGPDELVGEEGAGLLAQARDGLKHRKRGDMLEPKDEASLIKNHWRSKP